jgi:xanthine dehydrogenase accessory factor
MKREVLERLLAETAAKRAVVLVTALPSGEQVLVDPFADAGAAGVSAQILAAAREAALRDRSEIIEGPEEKQFVQVFNPPVRVILVGAVHIAQSLAPAAALVGYDVLVVDPRRAFASEERFPEVSLSTEWPDEAMSRVGLDRRTAVVTLTHDPKLDDPALVAALRSETFYIAALGSRKSHAARLDRLRALGFSDADLGRIHGPAGFSIGAVSPGEIAVSILAELVQCLRRAPSTGG